MLTPIVLPPKPSRRSTATVVTVKRDTEVAEPIEIVVDGPGNDQTIYGHLQIQVEELSRHRRGRPIREQRHLRRQRRDHRGRLGRARGHLDRRLGRRHGPISAHHAKLGKDAVLGHVNVTLGGDVVRTAATVRFTGPGGDAEAARHYFADDGQFFESRLLVDHACPNCKSDVLYKGALQGDRVRCPTLIPFGSATC